MKDEKQKKTIESAALDDEALEQATGGFGDYYPQPGVEPPPHAPGNDDNLPPELPPPGPNFF